MNTHPMINLIWLVFIIGVIILAIGEKHISNLVDTGTMAADIYNMSLITATILVMAICAIGICQFVGNAYAKKDEAGIWFELCNKRGISKYPPILIYKRKDKKTGVTKREFYTSIPMEQWKENREAICDRLNIHLVQDFTYGGKDHNKGDCICFESAEGRKPKDRGTMYDDEF